MRNWMKMLMVAMVSSMLVAPAFAAEGDKPKGEKPAAKGEKPGAGKGGPGKLDKDGDGVVTKEEAGDAWEKISKLDKDNDGKVTKEEAAAGRKAGGEKKPK